MGDGMTDIRDALSLRKIINAAGPVSAPGGGAPGAAATAAAPAILPHAVEIAQLQAIASRQIAQAFGCEAGCVAACSAAGITIAVAAATPALDRERVVRLPDTGGLKHRVVMQRGHDCNFGAQVSQMIRLAGAALDLIGTTERCSVDDLRHSLRGDVAAAVYVVSHHTAQTGMIDLRSFCSACLAAGVPVIVDAAGEHDLRDYLDAGADVAIASAHKNYGVLTAGIVAGRGALIDAMLLQDQGIGRPMKVAKEVIAAVIAALETWRQQDHQAVRTAWTRRAAIALDALADIREPHGRARARYGGEPAAARPHPCRRAGGTHRRSDRAAIGGWLPEHPGLARRTAARLFRARSADHDRRRHADDLLGHPDVGAGRAANGQRIAPPAPRLLQLAPHHRRPALSAFSLPNAFPAADISCRSRARNEPPASTGQRRTNAARDHCRVFPRPGRRDR